MNYLKHYIKLIRKSEGRSVPTGYTEKHHVFPISIYGKNNRVVHLTAREHYIAHVLLEKICIQRYGVNHWKTFKMNKAHTGMIRKKEGQNRYTNSRLFEAAKIRNSELMSSKMKGKYIGENNPMYGKSHKEETKRKIKNKATGRIVSDETKKKMSQSQKGKIISDETKNKLSIALSGSNNGMYGKTHSQESKNIISEKNKGKGCGENNPVSKLTMEDIINIRQILSQPNPPSQSHLAEIYGVSQSTISRINRKIRWNHI
jgi:hypothetical protein